MRVHCKAFPLRNFGRFTKADFALDFDAQRLTCPAGTSVPLIPGTVARFPSAACQPCPLRPQCTVAAQRSVSIHPHEPFLVELRARQRTTEAGPNSANGSLSSTASHTWAPVRQARSLRGCCKNLSDLRRHAAMFNLFAAAA